jgi:hypothetical protein
MVCEQFSYSLSCLTRTLPRIIKKIGRKGLEIKIFCLNQGPMVKLFYAETLEILGGRCS